MTSNEIVITLGLQRISQILNILGNPQNNLKIIHVAGTNGKGSVCAFISNILTQSGYKCGRFTSPQLIEVRDCIYIDEKIISSEDFFKYKKEIEELNLKFNIQATNFEILTAIAYLYFYQNNVDFAVIEVGLGGRLDATNVMDNSLVSVITSISYDHQEFLGDTIAKIAYEKACIMKKNGIVVISPQQYEETYSVFIEQAKIMNCQLIWVKKSKRDKTNSNFAISEDDFRYTLPLLGDMQLENSATALRVIRILQSKGYYFSDDNIICGIQTTKWPGRCEWVFTNKFGKILVDGAHNPGGASALSQFVEQQRKQGQRVIWIFGSSKPPSTTLKVLKELLKERDFFVASSFQTPENMPWIKSLDLNIAVDLVTKNFSTIQATRCENLNQLNTVLSSFPQDCIKVLCGSLYLVSEFFRILKEEKK